jgi:hypothetical protein
MKPYVPAFVLPAPGAASQRPTVLTALKGNRSKFHFKKAHLLLLLGLITPVSSFAAEPYCIAVDGGFGNGGTTFVARGFTLPAEGKCVPWAGYAKTGSSVVLLSSGTSCLSSDSKEFEVSVVSADPAFFTEGPQPDYIQMSRTDATQPFSGRDFGTFAGGAEPTTCTNDLLNLPSSHD